MICGLLAIFFSSISIYLFNHRTQRVVNEVSESFAEEKAEIMASAISTTFSNHIDMLNSCATLFDSVNLRKSSLVARRVRSIEHVGFFKAVGVVGADGIGADNEGNIFTDLTDKEFYIEALKGHPYVSDLVTGNDGVTNVIILSVPLMRGDVAAGVLFGIFDQVTLDEVISSSHDMLTGVNFLITRGGDILASSDPKVRSIIPGKEGYFATDQLWKSKDSSVPYIRERTFDKDRTVTYRYELDGEEKLTIITPVEGYSWVLAVVLPESAIKERTRMMGLYLSLLILGMVASMGLLITALVLVLKGDSDLVKHKERYELATRQSKAIIFDYDCIRKRLEFSGSYEIILPKGKAVLEGVDADRILDLIHPDDASFKKLLDRADKLLDSVINSEARLKCEDGEYRWFKLKANIVRGHDGRVKEIVGSMMDAEDHYSSDIGLKFREGIDVVTGMLKRPEFEKLAESKLRDAEGGSMYALYLIDIDNFTGVNELLGHAIGDKIISDTANKIGRVFTDKDCIGRLAGDEFAVLLLLSPETKRVGQRIVEDKAYRLCKTVDETYSNGKNDVRITVSVGVSCFPDDGRTYEDIYRRADAALYAAKHSGKNQCCIYRDGGVG